MQLIVVLCLLLCLQSFALSSLGPICSLLGRYHVVMLPILFCGRSASRNWFSNCVTRWFHLSATISLFYQNADLVLLPSIHVWDCSRAHTTWETVNRRPAGKFFQLLRKKNFHCVACSISPFSSCQKKVSLCHEFFHRVKSKPAGKPKKYTILYSRRFCGKYVSPCQKLPLENQIYTAVSSHTTVLRGKGTDQALTAIRVLRAPLTKSRCEERVK